jgi:hypothetical protein
MIEQFQLVEAVFLDFEGAGLKAGTTDQYRSGRLPAGMDAAGAKRITGFDGGFSDQATLPDGRRSDSNSPATLLQAVTLGGQGMAGGLTIRACLSMIRLR